MSELLNKGLNIYIKYIQKILINIFLFLVYFVIMGMTKIIVKIFQPSLINFYKKEDPCWEKPKNNEYNYKLFNNPW